MSARLEDWDAASISPDPTNTATNTMIAITPGPDDNSARVAAQKFWR
jgi:hypothetical protein